MSRNQRIKGALKSRGIIHEQLADLLGVKRDSVTQRINGEKEIDSIEFVEAVAKLTGFNFLYLLSGESLPNLASRAMPDVDVWTKPLVPMVDVHNELEELRTKYAELERRINQLENDATAPVNERLRKIKS